MESARLTSNTLNAFYDDDGKGNEKRTQDVCEANKLRQNMM